MTETVIPGTYIDVRAEGLISAGRIATGVLGIVGTAANGPLGVPVVLAMPSQARAVFGAPDDPRDPADGVHPLTLVRALELAYANGASSVLGVRVAGASSSAASLVLRDDVDQAVAALTAVSPGTWANGLLATVEPAPEDCVVDRAAVAAPFDELAYTPVVPSPRNRLLVTRGATRRTDGFEVVYRRLQADERVAPNAAGRYFLAGRPVEEGVPATRVVVRDPASGATTDYAGDTIDFSDSGAPADGQVRIDPTSGELVFSAAGTPGATAEVVVTYAVGHAEPTAGQVRLTTWNGQLDYAPGEAPSAAQGDTLSATYVVDRTACVRLTLTLGATVERYAAPDARLLCEAVSRSSRLVTAQPDDTHAGSLPAPVHAVLGSGSNPRGSNGAEAGSEQYGAGLDALAERLVNIVVLAGQDAQTCGSVLAGHLNQTGNAEHERIGVIGTVGDSVGELVSHRQSNGRLVVVAPGLRQGDGVVLPAGYTAAAVAGLIASVSPQTSLTNKPVVVEDIDRVFNRGEQAELLGGNVLPIVRKDSFRVLRGITSEGEGMPFSAIPTRRIVDYARYGVRSAANPYIGRFNNSRVRDALKSTIDGFLTRMVDDEALTGYELNVFADRAQERRGEVSVVMTLEPMFSMEFILVTMYLT